MAEKNRVIWSEGLFLRPQHFQQQERYLEAFVEGRAGSLRQHPWGFVSLEIERDLLAIGKLGLRRARGIFPDGTPFAMPEDDPLPAPLEVGAQLRDQVVHLAMPLRKSGATLTVRIDDSPQLTRYRSRDFETRDTTSESANAADIEVAAVNSRLMTQTEPAEDFAQIPLAHILECRPDRQVVLEERFIPTVAVCSAAPRLATFLSELLGMLHQRGDEFASQATATGRGDAAQMGQFLMLLAINRCEPVVAHWAANAGCHPEDLYRLMLELAGDLSTFMATSRRPAQFPAYRHEALRATFEPVIQEIRKYLVTFIPNVAERIPIAKKKFGISVATVADRTLFDSAAFVLAARADMPMEEFRRSFPQQLKIGSVDKIRDLVMLALPGIALQPMAVAPREIPYHAGHTYFEFDRSGELWRLAKTSGALAMHQAGEFAGLDVELWAIRR